MNLRGSSQIIYAYAYTYIHAIAVNKKGNHDFKEKQGEIYRRVWRAEREKHN